MARELFGAEALVRSAVKALEHRSKPRDETLLVLSHDVDAGELRGLRRRAVRRRGVERAAAAATAARVLRGVA